jgi:hypothetical protein
MAALSARRYTMTRPSRILTSAQRAWVAAHYPTVGDRPRWGPPNPAGPPDQPPEGTPLSDEDLAPFDPLPIIARRRGRVLARLACAQPACKRRFIADIVHIRAPEVNQPERLILRSWTRTPKSSDPQHRPPPGLPIADPPGVTTVIPDAEWYAPRRLWRLWALDDPQTDPASPIVGLRCDLHGEAEPVTLGTLRELVARAQAAKRLPLVHNLTMRHHGQSLR